MQEQVKIPITSTEYQARFSRPEVSFIGDGLNAAVKAIIKALLPFDFRLGHSEVIVNGPLSNYKAVFKLPERGITIQFGAEAFIYTKEGSKWPTAEADATILENAQNALLSAVSAEVDNCLVTVALHAQLLEKTREEILKPFIPVPFQAWRKLTSYGNHLKWNDGDLLLDFSAVVANGIFLKYSTQFKGLQPVETMLQHLRDNQNSIFRLLGIQEETNE